MVKGQTTRYKTKLKNVNVKGKGRDKTQLFYKIL